ncbi:MAG: amidase domain-containing protein [Oscillospiraceae bacterium]|jgi:cell wall-associated NlpC family hydrolase|nr:amidase domain-containing protein [Oscillospiraceae bacterium]
MQSDGYDRYAAIAYAHEWAYRRNPNYADFEDMGGDCSNFVSQALHAGGAKMNETPDTGWFYHSLNNRAAAWSGVPYLYQFLVNNRGRGPHGHVVPLQNAAPGDIIQLKFAGKADFSHSLLVVETGKIPTPNSIRIAAHSYDADHRALDTYSYVEARVIHIDGARA